MWSQLKLAQTLLTASLVAVLSWYLAREADCELPSIRNLSIQSLQELLSNVTLTSEDLVKTYPARIAEVKPSTPSVLNTNPVAPDDACKLDEERRRTGSKRSILHGIPISVKGSISVDGMKNSAGSYCRLRSRTENEASIITRLKKAGAAILDTTNMSEWGNSRSSSQKAWNGWSAVGGRRMVFTTIIKIPAEAAVVPVLPWFLDWRLVLFVSRWREASYPSHAEQPRQHQDDFGLLPRDNLIVTKLCGSVGPRTHTVKDSAIMLNGMAGPSPDDPLSLGFPFSAISDYTKSLNLDSLLNSRLTVPRNNADNLFTASMNLAPVMERLDSPPERVGPSEYRFDMENHFKSLVINPHNIQTMENLTNCIKSPPEGEYPSRDIAYWELVVKSADFQSPEIDKDIERMRYLGGEGGVDGVPVAAW